METGDERPPVVLCSSGWLESLSDAVYDSRTSSFGRFLGRFVETAQESVPSCDADKHLSKRPFPCYHADKQTNRQTHICPIQNRARPPACRVNIVRNYDAVG